MILYPATTTLSSVVRGRSLNQICLSERDSLWYVEGGEGSARYSEIKFKSKTTATTWSSYQTIIFGVHRKQIYGFANF